MIMMTPLVKNPHTAAQLAIEIPPSTKLAPLDAPMSHKAPSMLDLPPGHPIPPKVNFNKVPSLRVSITVISALRSLCLSGCNNLLY